MGNNEAAAPTKSEKAPSTVQSQDQQSIHPFPDWAAMQAYYPPGMMPPYFSPPVAPGHAPHPYMWGPQPIIPHFGSPYAAVYPPGGVFAHPAMPISSQAHGPGVAPFPTASEAIVMATPLSMEMQSKSSGNKDKSLKKRHKGLDCLAVSVGNGSAENTAGADGNGQSQSDYNSMDGSSDGSDGNNVAGGGKNQRKRSSEDIPSSGNPLGTMLPVPSMDPRISSAGKMKAIGTPILSPSGVVPHRSGVPSELWMQDERELKRERRKQSNRESARRSRLRKQAETEELSLKVETLSADNTDLRSEISRLVERCDKLRAENSALMEKLKSSQSSQAEGTSPDKMETNTAPSVVAENFLSIIDNQSSISRSEQQQDEVKLHQLMDTSPRTDAVAAS